MILNGEFLVDTVNGGAIYTSSSVEKFGIDRFRYMGKGTGQFTFRRSATAPIGFQNSGQIYITVPSAGSVGDDNYHIEIPIEGIDIRKLKWGTSNAENLTIQFMFANSVNGNYSLCVMEGRNSLHYLTTFSYSSGGGFQKIEITIPGCTTGSWQSGALNTYGLKIIFDLGSGANYEAPPNVWGPNGSWRVGDTVRQIEHPFSAMYIAAIQDDIGNVALPFRFVNYDDQLREINIANARLC